MDAEMEDPEMIFEVPEQIRDCQCDYDHVLFGREYRNFMQVCIKSRFFLVAFFFQIFLLKLSFKIKQNPRFSRLKAREVFHGK